MTFPAVAAKPISSGNASSAVYASLLLSKAEIMISISNDDAENALGIHNNRSTCLPNPRKPEEQNTKDHRARLSRFGVYGIQG